MANKQLIAALKSPPIRTFILGLGLSNIGTWIQRVTMGFLAFQATQSAAWVGIIVACEVIPNLLGGPFAGVLVDRTDRLKLFTWGQCLAQAQAFALAILAYFDLLSIGVLAVGAVSLGMVDGVNQPTRLTMIADVAPRHLVGSAVALNAVGFNGARFIGPMIAGVALATGGATVAFFLNGISFVPLLLGLFWIKRKSGLLMRPKQESIRDGLVGGLRHIRGHLILGPTFVMLAASAFLVRPLFELLPAISGLWFNGTPEQLAWLTSSIGLGAVIGSTWMLTRGSMRSTLWTVVVMPGILIAASLTFAAFGWYWFAAYPLLIVAGFAAVCSAVGMQSVIHFAANPAYLGRVLSLYGSFQRGLPACGAFVVGVIGDRIGLRLALLGSTAIAGVAWLFFWRKRHQLQAVLANISLPKDEKD